MQTPSGELVFYAAVLLGGAAYLFVRLPTIAAEYQTVAVLVALGVATEAVLLLVRFRWSPELFAALALFFLGWGVGRGAGRGGRLHRYPARPRRRGGRCPVRVPGPAA